MTLLSALGANALAGFKREFKEMMRVAFGMDKLYGQVSEDFNFYLPRYEKLIKSFDRKYKNLKLKLKRTEEELKMRIYIKERDVKKVYNDAASKIAGLKSIGANTFGKAEVSAADKFGKELSKVKDQMYISYYEADTGSNTIYLEYNKKQKMVEVHYDLKSIKECKSPEFKLVAFYAAKEFDPKIDLLQETSKFGFSSLLSADEKKEWLNDFNPNYTE